MKKERKLKLTLIIVIITLISIISFVGIYVQDMNTYKNILPEYLLSKDLNGYRRIELHSHDEENSTKENFELSKKIIQNRIESIGEQDYLIKQNLDNGAIVIEIPENSNTDRIAGQVSMQGKFEIIDAETNEVLMTNADIEKVEGGYASTYTNSTVVILNFKFNKEGTEKFKNITATYVQSEIEVEDQENPGQTKTETKDKDITMKIDGETILTTCFDQEISNGILQLTLGSSKNITTEELQEYYIQATTMAALLDSGNLPIEYELEQNKYILSDITESDIAIIVSAIIIIVVILMIGIIVKYKVKGILASISIIGYVALLLLAVRVFNVEISIAGIVGITFSIILYYLLLWNQLKEKEIFKTLGKFSLIFVPTLIASIVFTFANIAIGPILFWGLAIMMIYDASVTNWILKD